MSSTKTTSEEKAEERKKLSLKRYILLGIVGLIVIGLMGSSYYFYSQYQKTQDILKTPGKTSSTEVDELVKKVRRHYDLPTEDQATLATVSDVSKLSGQAFFAKAQNNDKVLIYPKSGLAILYRPATDKIINVGPVNTEGGAQPTPPVTSVSATVKVALYNGTKTVGLTKKAEPALQALSSLKVEVTAKENADANYPESIVVDLTGKNQQAANQLATFAKGKVASLPTGETQPTGADILIILGQTYAGQPTATPTP